MNLKLLARRQVRRGGFQLRNVRAVPEFGLQVAPDNSTILG